MGGGGLANIFGGGCAPRPQRRTAPERHSKNLPPALSEIWLPNPPKGPDFHISLIPSFQDFSYAIATYLPRIIITLFLLYNLKCCCCSLRWFLSPSFSCDQSVLFIIIIIIIKNECHSNIIVDRLQGCDHSKKLLESESE